MNPPNGVGFGVNLPEDLRYRLIQPTFLVNRVCVAPPRPPTVASPPQQGGRSRSITAADLLSNRWLCCHTLGETSPHLPGRWVRIS